MTKAKTRKAAGYVALIPSALLLVLKMSKIFLGFKLGKRKTRKYFLEGLREAGVSSREAVKIVRECFDERDKESNEEV